MKKIIIDTLGSDNGYMPIVTGALRALNENADLSIVFVGQTDKIEELITKHNADKNRISIIHTEEFVPDDAIPTCVFKDCNNTSMVLSLEHLKNTDDIIGMISAGNTGALLVGTIFRLGLIKGLRSPALATALPCKEDGGFVCLVDCGANTDCTPEDLKRFAVMGNAFMQSFSNLENPKVAMMSVGCSPHKGNALVKAAYPLIEALPLNFIGNIEGNHLINSEADVIVTDGFTGNVLLKNTEDAGMTAISLLDSMASNLPEYKRLREKLYKMFAFNDQGGAIFLGASKSVVKMHGCANADTAFSCIDMLLNLERGNFKERISNALNSL